MTMGEYQILKWKDVSSSLNRLFVNSPELELQLERQLNCWYLSFLKRNSQRFTRYDFSARKHKSRTYYIKQSVR